MKKSSKDEQLRIIETLLVHKADPLHIQGTIYNLNAIDLAANHGDPDVFALIRDFTADLNSMTASSLSLPTSPSVRSPTGSVTFHNEQPSTTNQSSNFLLNFSKIKFNMQVVVLLF